MPKRSHEELIVHYQRKIRKLEERRKKKGRTRIKRLFISSSDEENIPDAIDGEIPNELEYQSPPRSPPPTSPPPQPPTSPLPPQPDVTGTSADCATTIQESVAPTTDVSVEPILDPQLLLALGASTAETPEFGEPIYDSLAKLWLPLLKKGLDKEEKSKLMKQYLIPSNCKLLKAPKLNEEISAATSEVVRGRDRKLESFQTALGIGISAIDRGIDSILKTEDKVRSIKCLSDGCRVLTDLHFSFTNDRKKLITPSLDKNFMHMIQDTERDGTLFGDSLAEKIKASKAIEKQSLHIRKTANQKTPNVVSQPASASRPTHPGNWTGPPRYPSSRGGRGGQRKPAYPSRRNYPISSTVNQPPLKNPGQSKTRAN